MLTAYAKKCEEYDDESYEMNNFMLDDECFGYEDDADFRPHGRFHEAYMESIYRDYNN